MTVPAYRTAALVPAAGRGERLGRGTPKALRTLGGLPMYVHAVRALAASRDVHVVVVAVPEDAVEHVRTELTDQPIDADVVVVSGGETRQESVARALITLGDDIDVVLVHDAARPLVPVELVDLVAQSVRSGYPAVVPGQQVVDTIKQVDDSSTVTATPDRSSLRAIQTPQGFDRQVLQQAHASVDLDDSPATDDAGLVEQAGVKVHVVPGHEEAFKITTPTDLLLAEAILNRRRSTRG